MKTYIVTFEVNEKSRLHKMQEHLKTYGFYCPIHANCWAVKVAKSANEIRNELMTFQQPQDRIFVVRSGVEASWNATYGELNANWLKDHL